MTENIGVVKILFLLIWMWVFMLLYICFSSMWSWWRFWKVWGSWRWIFQQLDWWPYWRLETSSWNQRGLLFRYLSGDDWCGDVAVGIIFSLILQIVVTARGWMGRLSELFFAALCTKVDMSLWVWLLVWKCQCNWLPRKTHLWSYLAVFQVAH